MIIDITEKERGDLLRELLYWQGRYLVEEGMARANELQPFITKLATAEEK